jgi:hypothetical protein
MRASLTRTPRVDGIVLQLAMPAVRIGGSVGEIALCAWAADCSVRVIRIGDWLQGQTGLNRTQELGHSNGNKALPPSLKHPAAGEAGTLGDAVRQTTSDGAPGTAATSAVSGAVAPGHFYVPAGCL